MTQATETDTRELIIESAYGCFSKHGLQKTTMVDIAKAANVSRSTVYEYFRDKGAVLEACAEHASEQFYREMTKAMDRGSSLEEKLSWAAVFVSQARRAIASEEYFDEEAISLLLTKDAGVLLRSPARFARTSTSRPPANGMRESCSRCSALRHPPWIWTIPTSSPSSCVRMWCVVSPLSVHGRGVLNECALTASSAIRPPGQPSSRLV
jgi:AcrR family transcriptional regulator